MKLLKLSFFILLVFSIAACGDDEETPIIPTCNQLNWSGIYTGTIDCDGGIDSVFVTITGSGSDAVIVRYKIGSSTANTEYNPLTIDQCTISSESSSPNITTKIDAALDGDNLTFMDVTTVGTGNSTCVIMATRD